MKIFFTLLFGLVLPFAGITTVSGQQLMDSVMFSTDGSFLVPQGVDSLIIEVIGQGGNGGMNGGGGGGGGGYALGVYAVTAGSTWQVSVNIAGTAVNGLVAVTAGSNGYSVLNPSIGGGGAGGIAIGGTLMNYAGGMGGGGYQGYSGGGGGGAGGYNGFGQNGQNTTSSSCVSVGGQGGIGGGPGSGEGGDGGGHDMLICPAPSPAQFGMAPGGGGGGAGNTGTAGLGGPGLCKIKWKVPTGIATATGNLQGTPVYTIPFDGTIRFTSSQHDLHYQLYSYKGELIWEGDNIHSNNFSSLKSSVYLLRVQSEQAGGVYKVVVQK